MRSVRTSTWSTCFGLEHRATRAGGRGAGGDRALGAPVGIVPGGEKIATPAEMRRLGEIGIDFFDLYAQDMPAWMLAPRARLCP